MKLLYLTHKTYFRMEIFLRKVVEYNDLGKCLFQVELQFNIELGIDLLSTVYMSAACNILNYGHLCGQQQNTKRTKLSFQGISEH